MKKIILVVILIILSLSQFSGVSANTSNGSLTLSLTKQMQQQAKIDKKVFALQKIEEKKALLEAKRMKNKKVVTTSPQIKDITSIAVSSGLGLVPTLTIPPVPVVQTHVSQSPSGVTPIQENIVGVDMDRVRASWIGWYNDTRVLNGLSPYIYDTRLDNTAADWNQIFAQGKGINHHRRSSTDAYYDFPKIDAWFIERGINPPILNRTKHVENVGYGTYRCNSGDCTEALITAIRGTYNYFMSEKGKSYDAHYKSIVNPNFTKIGVNIIVVPGESRYYITIHYITE